MDMQQIKRAGGVSVNNVIEIYYNQKSEIMVTTYNGNSWGPIHLISNDLKNNIIYQVK